MSDSDKSHRAALDAYYREAGSWAEDRQTELRASRRIAWIVASVAVVVALFEAAALILLTPLKTVEPYTLMVDRNTGYVQALKPVEAQTIAPDAALTQSFLAQYVIARESFDVDALQANYRKVALWSINPARGDYVAGMQASNPASPLARLPRSSVVETRIKSVSPLGARAALVRFDTVRRDAGGQVLPPRAWVAVIRYRFSSEPLQLGDRLLNPLGFQVERYRRDQEQAPVAEPEPKPAATASATAAPIISVRPPYRSMPIVLPAPPTYQGPPRDTPTGAATR
ncbi:VirB8 family type IV secretion system protein [Sphingomonas immobilis]|uniref:VirB8/TrbF family protein n=1 Tax=Sphingomonas immobilis TaxID=3063997 RepID=A0ABT8ZZX7_9SPHN|nr:VirB8/TrbF family protein [Sphingomonas sp. CA1-15]MDO7843135.1 VirB8/TrbF family protein [Sphingomonas sp. CA1-15]